MLLEVLIGTVPLLALITATLGSILAGLATPTEAAGVGAAGALILMIAYRPLHLGRAFSARCTPPWRRPAWCCCWR